MKNLRPYHEHPLLQDYSYWPNSNDHYAIQFRADWWCNHCQAEIKGPPYAIGDYVVDQRPLWPRWRVYMHGELTAPLFETTRKAEALKHARQLERDRLEIVRAAEGDKPALASVIRQSKKDWYNEQES